jgi:hypothetical protein
MFEIHRNSCARQGATSPERAGSQGRQSSWEGQLAKHGVYPHDIVPPRSKYSDAGRFGRLFGELPPFAADTPDVRAALLEVGKLGGIMDAKDDLTKSP